MSRHPLATDPTVDRAVVDAVTAFLLEEARLLDGREWDAWLALWDHEGTYWIPQGPPDYDPAERVSLLHDTYEGLAIRVRRLKSGAAYAQDPPSETLHHVGNIVVEQVEDDELAARSNLMLLHHRRGRTEVLGGRVHHRLRHTPDSGLRILHKRIELLGSDSALGNLTFLF